MPLRNFSSSKGCPSIVLMLGDRMDVEKSQRVRRPFQFFSPLRDYFLEKNPYLVPFNFLMFFNNDCNKFNIFAIFELHIWRRFGADSCCSQLVSSQITLNNFIASSFSSNLFRFSILIFLRKLKLRHKTFDITCFSVNYSNFVIFNKYLQFA